MVGKLVRWMVLGVAAVLLGGAGLLLASDHSEREKSATVTSEETAPMKEIAMSTTNYCEKFQAASQKKLVYIEGRLNEHFASPAVAAECFPTIQQTEEGIKAIPQKCPITPLIYWLNMESDYFNGESQLSVIFEIEKSKADKLKEKLTAGSIYEVCGSVRPADKQYAIPVIKGILSSLKPKPLQTGLLLADDHSAVDKQVATEKSEAVTSGEEQCEKLSQETGEELFYGVGKLKSFGQLIPPAHTPINRDKPTSYWAVVTISDGKELEIRMRGKWEDSSAPAHILKATPPVHMHIGSTYRFCYQPVNVGELRYYNAKIFELFEG